MTSIKQTSFESNTEHKEGVERRYQKLVLILALCYTVFSYLSYGWPYLYTDQTQNFLYLAGAESIVDLTGPLPYFLSALQVLAYLGLYYFHSAGRLLFTVLLLFNVVLAPFIFGYSASVYLDTVIGYIFSLLEGVVLYMVYFTEISVKFDSISNKVIKQRH
ncbi:hypothetical protein [Litorilituus lipolyticus]|uniref:DUF2569 family protein n=1 Tax=Litorilituus lipolyticus TaxID=2491017 RepID=A0A502KVN8_9GAMM|nr:hypothetical protein [Litorilituus lipolyticus]TPH15718.1 hypothetical protein EPA86_09095 [Litorilituus lipolyticus]